MPQTDVIASPWIPRSWALAALFCLLLPTGLREQLGLLAQPLFWLLLAAAGARWQKRRHNAMHIRSPRRRRPAATRCNPRRIANPIALRA